MIENDYFKPVNRDEGYNVVPIIGKNNLSAPDVPTKDLHHPEIITSLFLIHRLINLVTFLENIVGI